MNILFLHGWHSVPGGVKPSYLQSHGHEVINPALDDDNFEAACATAQAAFDKVNPDVVVGSSRGGAVAMNINLHNRPLVLLCPAWKNWGSTDRLTPNSIILHSRADEVIPFEDSEELLVRNDLRREDTLIETGSDHRLADTGSLASMLHGCERHCEKLIGCDFGAPRDPSNQAKKIVLIEVTRVSSIHYSIRPWGRNSRLAAWAQHIYRTNTSRKNGKSRPRPGWTLAELSQTFWDWPTIQIAAMDFPFGIPQALLEDPEFANAVGLKQPFGTRRAWSEFVSRIVLFNLESNRSSEVELDLEKFVGWKDGSRFWQRRACDVAARAHAPLKHVGQSLFAMTLAGAKLLSELPSEMRVVVDQLTPNSRSIFETYPAQIAKRIGFTGRYKQEPAACIEAAERFIAEIGLTLAFDPTIRNFCMQYRSGPKRDDPDGSDALLCAIAAICCDSGRCELVTGDADTFQLSHEGGIVLPIGLPPNIINT